MRPLRRSCSARSPRRWDQREALCGVRALDRSRPRRHGAFGGVRALHGRRRAEHRLLDRIHRAHHGRSRREPLLSGVRRDARFRFESRDPDSPAREKSRRRARSSGRRHRRSATSRDGRTSVEWRRAKVVDTGSMDAGVEVSVCMGISFSSATRREASRHSRSIRPPRVPARHGDHRYVVTKESPPKRLAITQPQRPARHGHCAGLRSAMCFATRSASRPTPVTVADVAAYTNSRPMK